MLRNTEMLLREYGEFPIPAGWDETWVLKELNARLRPERRVRAKAGLRSGRVLYLTKVRAR